MIINALCQLYERLLEDPQSGISSPNYSKAKVSHEIVLDEHGEIVSVIDLRIMENKKLIAREIDVPEQEVRSSGIFPYFVCDKSKYVLGVECKKENIQVFDKEFREFRDFNIKLLSNIDDKGAIALINYLNLWEPEKSSEHPLLKNVLAEIGKGSFIVFRLKDDGKYIHQNKAIVDVWQEHKLSSASAIIGQCLITGEELSIARKHPNVQGVVGAQSIGASLVSFNLESSKSYKKEQSFNSPVSEKAAFSYTTALQYLLNSKKHRVKIGDTTTVFWAEKDAALEEDIIAGFLDISSIDVKNDEADEGEKRSLDLRTTQLIKEILERVKKGKSIFEGMTEVNTETSFYILGLSPNKARLAVRYWHVSSFEVLVRRIAEHYKDMAIVKADFEKEYIPVWRILKETASLGDSDRVSPLLAGSLMRSIFTGAAYPQSLYTLMLSRIRAENEDRKDGKGKKDKINYVRAAVLKACLTRARRLQNRLKDEVNLMELDKQSKNIAYLLGRLFCMLEKAQQDANPGINATIKDRYFGAASASPGSVFPLLMRLSQHHIAKAEYGFAIDKKIEEIMVDIKEFPPHFNLEEQGMFMLGYYHQRHALYQKNERKEV